jgi:threonine/homoserine/homoserine lactone efflux protein
MNRSLFISYLLTLTVLMLTPGPDMLFCLASGLKGGPRSGLLAATGAATGEVVHILNPKVALFTIALLPQFTDPQAGNLYLGLGAKLALQR